MKANLRHATLVIQKNYKPKTPLHVTHFHFPSLVCSRFLGCNTLRRVVPGSLIFVIVLLKNSKWWKRYARQGLQGAATPPILSTSLQMSVSKGRPTRPERTFRLEGMLQTFYGNFAIGRGTRIDQHGSEGPEQQPQTRNLSGSVKVPEALKQSLFNSRFSDAIDTHRCPEQTWLV